MKNPITTSSTEYSASCKITAPLVKLVYQQTIQYDFHSRDQQIRLKAEVRRDKKATQSTAADHSVCNFHGPNLQRSLEVASQGKGFL